MTRDELTERVIARIKDVWIESEHSKCPAITDATVMMDGLDFDSLDMVELVMSLEEEFDLELIEADILRSDLTVGDLVTHLAGKLQVAA